MFKKSSNLTKFTLPIAAALVLAGAVGFSLYHYHAKPKVEVAATTKPERQVNTVDYSSATSQDNAANEARKNSADASSKNGDSSSTLNSPDKPPAFSVTVSRANGSGQSITAAANVNGAASGTCVFHFSKSANGSPDVSSQPTQIQPSNQSSICPPTTQQLPSKGQWYVSVSVTSNGSTATSAWAANPVSL